MFEELKSILTDELNVDASLVTPEAEFVNDLKLNSLEIADFIVMCEDKFGIEISDSDSNKFITVGDVVNYLEALWFK